MYNTVQLWVHNLCPRLRKQKPTLPSWGPRLLLIWKELGHFMCWLLGPCLSWARTLAKMLDSSAAENTLYSRFITYERNTRQSYKDGMIQILFLCERTGRNYIQILTFLYVVIDG